MTALLGTRKRAEEFQTLLERASTAAPKQLRHPEPDSALSELVTVATALRAHASVEPRPEFAASLRERLLAEAEVVLTGDATSLALPVRRRGARERRLVAAAAAAVLVGGTAGVAAASQSALPGDTLYPLKRAVERAQAGLNTDQAGKGRDLLAQANDRLTEARGLLAQDGADAAQVSATIHDFGQQAQQGSGLLIQSFEADRDPSSITAVREFAAQNLTVLQELAKTAPPPVQESLADAAVLLQDLDEQALTLCSVCADDLPALRTEDLLLTAAAADEASRALHRAARKLTADTSATGETEVDAQTPVTESLPGAKTKAHTDKLPSAPSAPSAPSSDGTVRKAGEEIQDTVDETVDPVEDVVDELLPGVGGLVGSTVDGLTSGLTRSGQ